MNYLMERKLVQGWNRLFSEAILSLEYYPISIYQIFLINILVSKDEVGINCFAIPYPEGILHYSTKTQLPIPIPIPIFCVINSLLVRISHSQYYSWFVEHF